MNTRAFQHYKVLLFASYPTGNEYELKQRKIERLKRNGLNIELGYLVNLHNYGKGDTLPVEYLAEREIKYNIRKYINIFGPNIVAFHSGMAFREFWPIIYFHIWDIYIRHKEIVILVEGHNKGELSVSTFEKLDKLDKVVSKTHELYDIIWNE